MAFLLLKEMGGWLGEFRTRVAELTDKAHELHAAHPTPPAEFDALLIDVQNAISDAVRKTADRDFSSLDLEDLTAGKIAASFITVQEQLTYEIQSARSNPLDKLFAIDRILNEYDANIASALSPVIENLHESQSPFLEEVVGFSFGNAPLTQESTKTIALLMLDRAETGWKDFGPPVSPGGPTYRSHHELATKLHELRRATEFPLHRAMREIDAPRHEQSVDRWITAAAYSHQIEAEFFDTLGLPNPWESPGVAVQRLSVALGPLAADSSSHLAFMSVVGQQTPAVISAGWKNFARTLLIEVERQRFRTPETDVKLYAMTTERIRAFFAGTRDALSTQITADLRESPTLLHRLASRADVNLPTPARYTADADAFAELQARSLKQLADGIVQVVAVEPITVEGSFPIRLPGALDPITLERDPLARDVRRWNRRNRPGKPPVTPSDTGSPAETKHRGRQQLNDALASRLRPVGIAVRRRARAMIPRVEQPQSDREQSPLGEERLRQAAHFHLMVEKLAKTFGPSFTPKGQITAVPRVEVVDNSAQTPLLHRGHDDQGQQVLYVQQRYVADAFGTVDSFGDDDTHNALAGGVVAELVALQKPSQAWSLGVASAAGVTASLPFGVEVWTAATPAEAITSALIYGTIGWPSLYTGHTAARVAEGHNERSRIAAESLGLPVREHQRREQEHLDQAPHTARTVTRRWLRNQLPKALRKADPARKSATRKGPEDPPTHPEEPSGPQPPDRPGSGPQRPGRGSPPPPPITPTAPPTLEQRDAPPTTPDDPPRPGARRLRKGATPATPTGMSKTPDGEAPDFTEPPGVRPPPRLRPPSGPEALPPNEGPGGRPPIGGPR